MTEVKVKKSGGHIVEVECKGHAGYGVEGEDVVCAGLSAIIQTALLGLLQVAKIQVKYSSDAKSGNLKIKLPDNLTEKEQTAADIILETMMCGVSDLREGYSDYIDITEVK